MGVVNGLWCIGCCVGLTLALLALGMMSIGWMVAVGVAIVDREDDTASASLASRVTAVALAAGSGRMGDLSFRVRGDVLRVVQLRGDLPVPDGRRRARRPLDLRRLLRRPLLADRGGRRRRRRRSTGLQRRARLPLRRRRARLAVERRCSISTRARATSSARRSQYVFLEGHATHLPWIRKARHLIDVRTSEIEIDGAHAARRLGDRDAGDAPGRDRRAGRVRDSRLRPRRLRALRGRADGRRRSVRVGAHAATAPTSPTSTMRRRS